MFNLVHNKMMHIFIGYTEQEGITGKINYKEKLKNYQLAFIYSFLSLYLKVDIHKIQHIFSIKGINIDEFFSILGTNTFYEKIDNGIGTDIVSKDAFVYPEKNNAIYNTDINDLLNLKRGYTYYCSDEYV